MPTAPKRVLVTGANGNLGRALFSDLADQASRAGSSPGPALRAAVRSERAAALIAELPERARPETVIVDYRDEARMRAASEGCDAIVHLVGIIKEGANTSYAQAHEESCRVLARAAAAAGAQRIVYLSLIGSTPNSANACLRSRGLAELELLGGSVPATILRVPMVLGRGDYATAALRKQARASKVALVGGGRTLQQPIDARDLLRAITLATNERSGDDHVLDLGGPESLSHRDLVARAARSQGREAPRVLPIPMLLARVFAAVAAGVLPNPPITPAMLGVLQHDDRVDPEPACKLLGLDLTPLDDTLAHCLAEDPGAEEENQ